ncbi:undecaprenyl-diphosphate phosphatase [uncultured Tyzzerella sp.]|uniref:undecaprenyl-diphosphate phosphatase n=1 Tax=uncultured Tyzzerella sp. TaxID=2321398 RepID=UPI002943E476|nr:undecaprenyl-diphosphate phosphatase [uncultured Tyzzerella sp.]
MQNIIEILKAIFLGIVEGITEWLPISSTGHMILVDEFLQLNLSDDFKSMFFVVIQLGAILAVIFIYFNKLNPFAPSKTKSQKHQTFILWFKVIFACIPAGIIGLLFDDKLDALFYNYQTVAAMLIVYGILFIYIENTHKDKSFKINTLNALSYKTAFMIGLFQVLALIPGTSRSGATIVGAMLIGTSRIVATEFTFFLAIPVMFGASILKILKFGFSWTPLEIQVLLVGCAISFIVSIFAIKFLVNYIKTNDFKAFGYYRIVLGILVLGYFFLSK